MQIDFSSKYLTGNEIGYIHEVLMSNQLSGDGNYTKKCQEFFFSKYNMRNTLLTTSGTHSLELAALLLKIKKNDEVIMPSFTFPSTANAFLLRGAKIIFADSRNDHPNIDVSQVNELVTSNTKAIVPVHYAGVACDMDLISEIATDNGIYVIEDAAQCVDAFYNEKPLGSIGDIGCFSFHDTKNIICGEGGLISMNNPNFTDDAEIIREKGTNRSSFFRGEIDKYGWVSMGSSYLPSEILAAFLYSQLEEVKKITSMKKSVWAYYFDSLNSLSLDICLPVIPDYSNHNAHIFHIVLTSEKQRNKMLLFLKKRGIQATFHYQALHASDFFKNEYDGPPLANSIKYSNCLLRLPIYPHLKKTEQNYIIDSVAKFFKN
ncbi:MAG: dTDP-4-amino-4,6-dideoxygalactose transaminase [Candidatus Marinimicrobia bacterium]|jgi:dTDP-4-amino-4,6-dideoxygalactose transaminase|nr:dTDP-4-amino-4,6-dideoxygalactose transaminase [Candidatus Neomarinimicrobiota bacterium]